MTVTNSMGEGGSPVRGQIETRDPGLVPHVIMTGSSEDWGLTDLSVALDSCVQQTRRKGMCQFVVTLACIAFVTPCYSLLATQANMLDLSSSVGHARPSFFED